MRQVHIRALALIALSAPLGACNSFLGIHFARHAAPVPEIRLQPQSAQAAADAAGGQSATALGRRQLAEGQVGLAIETFRKALAGGEPIAPAVNGLGVAYARIGRFDLAQRYFEQAIASDPVEPKYADNLARLMRSPALAMRRDGDMVAAALKAAAPVVEAKAERNARAEPAQGQLQRVSRGEVRIATAPPQAPPITLRTAAVDSKFKPLVRFSLAELPEAKAQHQPTGPIRIVLPEPTGADAATVEAAAKVQPIAGERR